MKKRIIIILVCLVLILLIAIGGFNLYKYFREKTAIVKIELKEDLEVNFLSNVKVSDFIKSINGKLVNDYIIDTTKVGKKKIKYEYINEENIKLKESFEITIVDTVAPVVWLGNSYNITVGNEVDLTKKILCGDNYDNNPTCEIIGTYDIYTVGSYPLTFKATDSSGNETLKEFTLNVKAKSSGTSSSSSSTKKTYFSDIVKNYKTDTTEIGIDISKRQGNVDFEALKEAGVEFVIIRIGSASGIDGERYLDSKFEQNIRLANEAGIPVGIYYYSYANSTKRAIEDAKWIVEQIKDYKVDLPIAFDWENWSSYNDYNLSFFGLTSMANSFLDVVKEAGYEGLVYSSKTYLENMWLDFDYPVWLAHYVTETNYEGNYSYWQMCSNGRVDGINGDVDIDIRYLKN